MTLTETQKKLVATILFAVTALVATFLNGSDGPDPDQDDRDTVEALCNAPGLSDLARFGEVGICLKDPDPKRTVGPIAAGGARVTPNTFYRQSRLCPGDGTSGHRVRVYAGAPVDRPAVTEAQMTLAHAYIAFVERTLQLADDERYQKLNWYCADDTTPTITPIIFPAVGADGKFSFADYKQAIDADGRHPRTIHHAIIFNLDGAYPYAGQGTVMALDESVPPQETLDAPHYSLTNASNSAFSPINGATMLHEIGHNLGAVQPASHHSTGDGYHCTDQVTQDGSWNEIMCYDDGGNGIAGDNHMAKRCDFTTWMAPTGSFHKLEPFDCDNDFYDPALPSTGYFTTHWNVASSPYLTPPRRRP